MIGSFCPLPQTISQHTRPLPQDFDSSHSTSSASRLSQSASRSEKSSSCCGVTGTHTLLTAFGGSLRQQTSFPVSQVLLPHTIRPNSGRRGVALTPGAAVEPDAIAGRALACVSGTLVIVRAPTVPPGCNAFDVLLSRFSAENTGAGDPASGVGVDLQLQSNKFTLTPMNQRATMSFLYHCTWPFCTTNYLPARLSSAHVGGATPPRRITSCLQKILPPRRQTAGVCLLLD